MSSSSSSCSPRRWLRSCKRNLQLPESRLLEPGAPARDVPHLARDRERADLVAQDVDPAGLAELQRRRLGDRHPETIAARVLRTPEERLVVDPQTDGPRDGNPGVTAAFRHRAHCLNRLTGTPEARRRPWRASDEAQCPSIRYIFRAIAKGLAARGVRAHPPPPTSWIVNLPDGGIYWAE